MTQKTTGKRRSAAEKKTTKGGGRVFVGKGKTKFASHVSEASKRYLARQEADPFSDKALAEGYRSRAAYKLLGIHEKYKILDGLNRTDARILDLGCAPGSWLEVLANRCPKAQIEGIDLLPVDPVAGCTIYEESIEDFLERLRVPNNAPGCAHVPQEQPDGDFCNQGDRAAQCTLTVHEPRESELGVKRPSGVPVWDVILSDMAMNTIGNSQLDALRTQGLADLAAHVALEHLKPGGHFATKLFQGGQEQAFAQELRKHFTKVAFCKPAASRKDSKEIFLVALGRKT